MTVTPAYDTVFLQRQPDSPQKFLCIVLRVSFEERHLSPDGRQHLMRTDDGPLTRPHHSQQCTQLVAQTSAIDSHTTDTMITILIMSIFIVLSSRLGHCKRSHGSHDECPAVKNYK